MRRAYFLRSAAISSIISDLWWASSAELIAPSVYQKHGLRVVKRKEIFVSLVPLFGSYFIHKPALRHFACKLFCAAVFAGIVDIDSEAHFILPYQYFSTLSTSSTNTIAPPTATSEPRSPSASPLPNAAVDATVCILR